MNWLRAVEHLRAERRPGVLVTVTSVRGHAPRDAGSKMVVAADGVWDTIGGGNLEATAIARARELIASGHGAPETLTLTLSDRAQSEHGQQCCGGEVSVLLEPLAVVPAVAIFGVGHVGLELARILARRDVELHLVDSRAQVLEPERLRPLADALARVHVHHAPVPELVLGQVPAGTHVLIMTHDHAEDAALCDAALRCTHLGSIGLIGSSSKWRRFESLLAREGHAAEAIARITSPIGLPGLEGKDPSTVAISVAAALVQAFERDAASAAHGGAAAQAATQARPR
ncbi:xanthine dehydrogenase accessory protein XdhC [Intrasporangium sp.]|uniref:xanthine dehydrogenase accessory protein XdhC n=1 Tax=Intrasporangium sp. TaxID=1925024 RepID=UPI00293A3279|nr:xanthine dehydrogenase accessory protein XdhC [Intrasporangium sp.]MDV3222835.1 xanthine dehydrogenase accessory protein XdhC [Intrasporangium sp.]